ncbi:type I glyceraldehyde-3-phosphate dehydrogenase [Noviherbaspirillum denitrificans]|uniref:Glyceraldehyde-3-phosphate dehydrogenase n=1 Tax=Noviherbaspirillum denitrificans TaxID=1968433 RepID=A0A254TEP4_9BURK|nr:glyceraldehyde 3-phosphate dehydrogenase NAD-binding domain-containing protein [Noviherbaspirillum denitrificans]OWW20627.1 glyceraldehyde-3-phosphate dehydrogenase [Noviherbaspirillum denitrificans]
MDRPVRIAINGYGRIGRCVLRALHESPFRDRFSVVAINEPADLETIVYLTQYDSTHGMFRGSVALDGDRLRIDGAAIAVTHAERPEDVDWKALEIDLLLECSGRYSTRGELGRFLKAGCPRVLVSQPCRSAADVDSTVVFGTNHQVLTGQEQIVSSASCTTNAIVPVLDQLDRVFGIDHAFLTTMHSVMNDQPLIDGYHHSDLRLTRSAMQSMVPVSTGLAQGVVRMLPGLQGRIVAKAVRVPIPNVSAIDVVASLRSDATAAAINDALQRAAGERPALLTMTSAPHASIDFNHNPHSAIIDANNTRMAGERLANLLVWFDNEWGFANRMLDVARYWSGLFPE